VVHKNAQRLSAATVVEEDATGPGAVMSSSGGVSPQVGALLGHKGALCRTFGSGREEWLTEQDAASQESESEARRASFGE
jgi:hypothetical protein